MEFQLIQCEILFVIPKEASIVDQLALTRGEVKDDVTEVG